MLKWFWSSTSHWNRWEGSPLQKGRTTWQTASITMLFLVRKLCASAVGVRNQGTMYLMPGTGFWTPIPALPLLYWVTFNSSGCLPSFQPPLNRCFGSWAAAEIQGMGNQGNTKRLGISFDTPPPNVALLQVEPSIYRTKEWVWFWTTGQGTELQTASQNQFYNSSHHLQYFMVKCWCSSGTQHWALAFTPCSWVHC